MPRDRTSGVVLRRADRKGARATIARGDFAVVGSLLLLAPAAWLLPERAWPGFTRLLATLRRVLGIGKEPVGDDKLALVFPVRAAAPEFDAIRRDNTAGKYELRMQVLRDWRPGGWRPAVELRGREHLDAALGAGKGAVLWVSHFVFNGLIAKKALHEAGYPVAHVSRPEHGFSKTRFGIAALNPIRCGVEDRYLHARILVGEDRMSQAMRRLHRLLKGNGIATITVGAWEGRQIAEVPFRDGGFRVATGAVRLAASTGAALLPLTVVRDPTDGRFVITIEPALPTPAADDKTDTLAPALVDYVERLLPQVERYPAQWRGWSWLTAPGR